MAVCRKLAVAAVAFLMGTLARAAYAEHRVALVIGNDQYQNLPKLQKAVADARSYADVLNAKGFDQVILKNDLTRGQLDEAIAAFLDQIEPGDTAVFAYSGHGWSDGTQNFIVGIDAPLTGSQDFLARISIPLKNGTNGVIDEMDQKGATLKVAIIDACRDNPFTPPAGKRSIGLSRGMARIDPPNGTFVVFSAGAGQSALDRLSDSDPDPNSVFTRIFVPAIRADLTLQEAIKTTQATVVSLAKSVSADQRPAYYDEVVGSACLANSCTPATAHPTGVSRIELAEAVWKEIRDSSDPMNFEHFVQEFPDSSHVSEAITRNKELIAKTADVPTSQPTPFQVDVADSNLIDFMILNSPAYDRNSEMVVKLKTHSNGVHVTAVVEFSPTQIITAKGRYNMAEGGIYVALRVPSDAPSGEHKGRVLVSEIGTKLEESIPFTFSVH